MIELPVTVEAEIFAWLLDAPETGWLDLVDARIDQMVQELGTKDFALPFFVELRSLTLSSPVVSDLLADVVLAMIEDEEAVEELARLVACLVALPPFSAEVRIGLRQDQPWAEVGAALTTWFADLQGVVSRASARHPAEA